MVRLVRMRCVGLFDKSFDIRIRMIIDVIMLFMKVVSGSV